MVFTRTPVTIVVLGATGAVLALMLACGGNDDEGIPAPTTPAPTVTSPGETPSGSIAPQPESPQAIEEQVTEVVNGVMETQMGDNFFTRNNLKAPMGEPLTINLTNEGSAIHNFRLAGPDGAWSTSDDVVSDPDIVPGGTTAVVE